MRKSIRVACGVVYWDGRILVAQRSESMSHPFKWEFPGGKIEARETPQKALIRELKEELNLVVHPLLSLPSYCYRYPSFDIEMHPIHCIVAQPRVELREHRAYQWSDPKQLYQFDWSAADLPLVHQLINHG